MNIEQQQAKRPDINFILCLTCWKSKVDGVDAHRDRHLREDRDHDVGGGGVAGDVGDGHREQADQRVQLNKKIDEILGTQVGIRRKEEVQVEHEDYKSY